MVYVKVLLLYLPKEFLFGVSNPEKIQATVRKSSAHNCASWPLPASYSPAIELETVVEETNILAFIAFYQLLPRDIVFHK